MTKRVLSLLRGFLQIKQKSIFNKHNRFVPAADYIQDRWERASAYGFGRGSSVYDSCLVLGTVKVGENTWVGPFTVLDGSGGLSIGENCAISAGVQIYSHDSVDSTLSGGRLEIQRSSTIIGSNCYIGPNTIISKGVVIGDGVTIGANSFVSKDLPSGVKAYGSPCRIC